MGDIVFLVQAVTELSVFFVSTLNAIKKQEEIEKKKMNLEPKTHIHNLSPVRAKTTLKVSSYVPPSTSK